MRLENNNPKPVGHQTGGVVPKAPSYIDEVKTQNAFATDQTGQVIGGAVKDIYNIGMQYAQKSLEMKAVNGLNDYNLEYQNLTQQYKADYARDPDNKDTTKIYESNVKNLQQKYDKQVSEFYKPYLQKQMTDLSTKSNLDFYRKETDLTFQMKKFEDGMNNDIQQFKNVGISGGSPEELLKLAEPKEAQAIQLLGEYNGKKMATEYKNNASISYIAGLTQNNPELAINMLDNKIIKDNITDKSKIALLKEVAVDRQKKLFEWQKEKYVAQQVVEDYALFGEILKRPVTVDEIMAYSEKNNLSNDETNYFLDKAGYPKIYHLKDGEKAKADGSGRSAKISDEEKAAIKNEIYLKIQAMYATEEPKMEDVKALEQLILKSNDRKIITDTDTEDFLKKVLPKVNSVLATETKEKYDDDGGWSDMSIGYTELNKKINAGLKSAGLPKAGLSPEKLKEYNLSKKDTILYYDMQNRPLQIYNEVIDKATEHYSITKNKPFIDTPTTLKSLSHNYTARQKIYDDTINETMRALADANGIETTKDGKYKTLKELEREEYLLTHRKATTDLVKIASQFSKK
jgi:hypothetical protein